MCGFDLTTVIKNTNRSLGDNRLHNILGFFHPKLPSVTRIPVWHKLHVDCASPQSAEHRQASMIEP